MDHQPTLINLLCLIWLCLLTSTIFHTQIACLLLLQQVLSAIATGAEPVGEGLERPHVRPVVPHGEVQQRPPREVRVRPRVGVVHQLLGRPDHLVHLRAQEEGERAACHPAVDDGAVEAAPVAPVGERHEGVADVDDEGARAGPDGAPRERGGVEHLESAHVVLVQDGERRGVAMRPRAQRVVGPLARRVVVEAHDGVVPLEEAPEVAPAHAQALA
uniref:Uncharacterized protein n=1 Tax=Zea mays TaxID=4577 RepID=A0A804M7N3_MAIZE